ncbi:sigma-54-dependent Fis family transcriptional regulator [Myxococcota bacterium]|nr:sigma-54-dependent Fis family transcriptional regulator [Myxococcota bacterium]
MGWTTEHTVDETFDSSAETGSGAHAREGGVRARLVSAFPRALSVSIDLGEDRVVLGRQPDEATSPPIHHPTVSRAHYAIEWDAAAGVHVGRDLGSRNGSAVDGVRTTGGWQPLVPGTVVRIGDVLFVYEEGHTLDEPEAPEVSRAAIPGRALAVKRLRAKLSRAAPDVSPVLVVGETGTGKESIAAELHARSGRKGPFVAVNCATLGEQLIESQLFGHVKGAFTGATTDQPGLFRAAEGGTLFLDEIGELPKELQPKLLRAIQEREVMAVGSTRAVKVDVRIVAATLQRLAERATRGEFRQDLYARLALWELAVPSLAERRADVIEWIERLHHLWLEERGQSRRDALVFEADAAEELVVARWSENLRGLGRFVHELASRRIVGRPISRRDLPDWVRAGGK